MGRRTTRRVTMARRATAAIGMVLGAVAVTHGSAHALQPMTADQLTAASCASQHATVQPSKYGLVISGLDHDCAGLNVAIALGSAGRDSVVTVRGVLHQMRQGESMLVPAPAAVMRLTIRSVSVAFTDASSAA